MGGADHCSTWNNDLELGGTRISNGDLFHVEQWQSKPKMGSYPNWNWPLKAGLLGGLVNESFPPMRCFCASAAAGGSIVGNPLSYRCLHHR